MRAARTTPTSIRAEPTDNRWPLAIHGSRRGGPAGRPRPACRERRTTLATAHSEPHDRDSVIQAGAFGRPDRGKAPGARILSRGPRGVRRPGWGSRRREADAPRPRFWRRLRTGPGRLSGASIAPTPAWRRGFQASRSRFLGPPRLCGRPAPAMSGDGCERLAHPRGPSPARPSGGFTEEHRVRLGPDCRAACCTHAHSGEIGTSNGHVESAARVGGCREKGGCRPARLGGFRHAPELHRMLS
jgi:hypothetical protein